jgi:hypothetical protein
MRPWAKAALQCMEQEVQTSSRCLLGIVKMCSRITPALCAAWTDRNPLILRNYRIAKSPNRRGAHFAESSSRQARPRDSARFDQPWVANAIPGTSQSGRPQEERGGAAQMGKQRKAEHPPVFDSVVRADRGTAVYVA